MNLMSKETFVFVPPVDPCSSSHLPLAVLIAVQANTATFSLTDISDSNRVRNEVGSLEYGNNAPREPQSYNSRKSSRLQLEPTTVTGFTVCGHSVCHAIQILERASR